MRWKPIDSALLCAWILFVVVGLVLAPDYGLGWDEPINRQYGQVSYQYVAHDNRALFSYKDRYYGVAFEWPMYMLEKLIGVVDPFDVFVLRHRVTFIIFAVAVFVWYLVAASFFGRRAWGVLAALFLVLHPRILAESFYNPKDMVFLSACVFAFGALYWYAYRATVSRLILAGIAVSWAMDIRVVGMLFHIVAVWIFVQRAKVKNEHWGRALVIYCAVSLVSGIAFWPFLWEQPVTRFIAAVKYASSFSEFQKSVLYFGSFIPASHVPWHYVLTWIAITTPLSILATAGIGVCRAVAYGTSWMRIMVLWIVLPVGLAALSSAELYDGWRQFYFLYPAIVMLAVYGCIFVLTHTKKVKHLALCILIVSMGSVCYFIWRSHPHQYVYFNEVIGGIAGARGLFDLDYWGVSFRRGLEHIAQRDDRSHIPVFLAFGVKGAVDVLKAQDRRFVPVDKPEQADYILSNFRWQENEPPYPVIFTLAVDDVAILRVYDRRLHR